jgi:hypothetical protein
VEIIPIARWSNTGVYAVNALRYQSCLVNCEESGGGYESWWKVGGLDDLAKQIPERPLYVSQDEEGRWFQVPEPEGFDPDDIE